MPHPNVIYRIAVTLPALLGLPAASYPAAVSFNAPRAYTAGASPNSVAVGDFNGDGQPDLVVSNSEPTVSILLGTGAGTFGPPLTFPAGAQPTSVTVADFNGDGKADVVIANYPTSNISILFGNGDGTLQSPVTITAGLQNARYIGVGDFNGDGKPDVLISGSLTGAISVLISNGDGTFQPPRVTSGGDGGNVVIGDFNLDGKLDVATVASSPCTVYEYPGNGDGSFQKPSSMTISKLCGGGDFGVGITAYDFNRDGKLDLAVSKGNSEMAIFLGNGDGTFEIANVYHDGSASAFAVADFNGDGRPDLAMLDEGTLAIFLGKGDGSFEPPDYLANGGTAYSLAVADFNADGRPDVAIATEDYGDVTVLLGLREAVHYPMGGAPLGPAVAADFNGDGKADLAVAITTPQNTGAVTIRLGLGDGTFGPPAAFAAGQSPGYMVAGDFNGDGKMDLAVANYIVGSIVPSTVSILIGNGDGTFQPPVAFTVGSGPGAVAVSDFNRDGKQDLAVFNINGTVSLLLGNGDGTFQPQIVIGPGSWEGLAVADFNKDGNPDLAFIGYGGNQGATIDLLLGNGDGTFQPARTSIVGGPSAGYIQLTVGDFNGDGYPDLALTNEGVAIVLGNGDGFFQAPTFMLNSSFKATVAVDLDHDGKQDLVLAGDQLGILLGDGDGSFHIQRTAFIAGEPATEESPYPLYGIAVADFNGDGKPDLALTYVQNQPHSPLPYNKNESGVSVLLNLTP